MKSKNVPWFWIGIGALVALVAVVGWTQFRETSLSTRLMTKQEAKVLIQERYQGEVSAINVANQQYQLELKKQNKLFLIKIDQKTGSVLSIEAISSNKEETPNEPTQESPNEEQPQYITDAKAIQIALNHIQGVVDSVALEMENNQTFYLVEIETADEQEAIVQVHAISGEVMSVTWDDDTDDNEDDD